MSTEFIVDDSIFGCSQQSADFMHDLGLSQQHISLLFVAFADIDANNSFTVRMDEVVTYFKVDSIKYLRKILGQFEHEKCGLLNFLEFTTTLWNFLTIDESMFVDLTFEFHENKVGNMLQGSDVVGIFEGLCSGVTDSKRKRMISDITTRIRTKQTTYPLAAYKDLMLSNKVVLGPLVAAQQTLRNQIIGESFWIGATKNRMKQTGIGNTAPSVILAQIAPMRAKIDMIRKMEMKNLYKKKARDAQEMQRVASIRREMSAMKILNDQLRKKSKKAKKKKQVGDFSAIDEETVMNAEGVTHAISLPEATIVPPEDLDLADVIDLPSSNRKRRSSMLLMKKPNLLENTEGDPLKSKGSGKGRQGLGTSKKDGGGSRKVSPQHVLCTDNGANANSRSMGGGGVSLPKGWVLQRDSDGEVSGAPRQDRLQCGMI